MDISKHRNFLLSEIKVNKPGPIDPKEMIPNNKYRISAGEYIETPYEQDVVFLYSTEDNDYWFKPLNAPNPEYKIYYYGSEIKKVTRL